MPKTRPLVSTTEGKLEGFSANGVFVFRGIPYAAPPTGNLRWQAPQPVTPWSGTRSAYEFGPVSYQGSAPPGVIGESVVIVPGERSEDCLYLNVWTPALDDRRRPVMFWIHGGGLEVGSGSQPNYDGTVLARDHDVVVVTINYRLGALGYLRLCDVTRGRIPSTGNEGRMDEIAALRWVQRNIERFGGDPDNVTIFGQSAGSIEVACLLTAVPAKGLFRRAVLHSTAAHTANSVDHANTMSEIFLGILGIQADDVERLLALAPEQLVSTSARMLPAMVQRDPKLGRMHFNPVIDGTFLPKRPYDAVLDGAADNISIMVGTTLDETRLALGSTDAGAIEDFNANAQALCRHYLGEEAPRMMAAYAELLAKRGKPCGAFDVQLAIETDRVLRFPSVKLCEALNQRGNPARHFIVTYESPHREGLLGAPHAIELAFLFGTHQLNGTRKFGGEGRRAEDMAVRMQSAWTAFARCGDPSCDAIGEWPPYAEDRQTMLIGEAWQMVAAPYEEERLLWENFPGDAHIGLM